MVNITYGVLPQSGSPIDTQGTDMIVVSSSGSLVAYNPGDLAWIMTCTALVFLMIPGLGYLYSGLARRKNALHMLLMTFMALTVVSVQWICFGYSITFSSTGGNFIGNLKNAGFIGVLGDPVSSANNKIPEIVYAMYELEFACLVPAIAIGAACERARVWPFLVFTLVWTTFCYDIVAHAIWSSTGWAYTFGVLDYAGGGPVEIVSGVTGTVISYYLGKRKGYGTDALVFKPHNVSHVVLGTALLWFGWLGFNGGSTFAANLRAGMALATTNTAASTAAITWMALDYRLERKWSVVGFCTGAIAGLVAITPAAGYIGVPASFLVGFLSALISNLCTKLKVYAQCDDVMDVFAVHAVAGIVGLLLTGIFTQASVANNDGYLQIPGGWLDGNFIQLPYQIAWCAFCVGWTAATTYAIMFIIDHTPGIGPFRASEMAEIIGVDEEQLGEYVADYAYFNRDLEGNYDPEHGQKLSMMEHQDGNGGVKDQAANAREASGGNKHADPEAVASSSPAETAAEDHEEKKLP
jgi:Amt family ammonium transporter